MLIAAMVRVMRILIVMVIIMSVVMELVQITPTSLVVYKLHQIHPEIGLCQPVGLMKQHVPTAAAQRKVGYAANTAMW